MSDNFSQMYNLTVLPDLCCVVFFRTNICIMTYCNLILDENYTPLIVYIISEHY